MTPSQLKQAYEAAKPDGFYFTRDNMKFAGDTMRNYGVITIDVDGEKWYILHRKQPVKHGLQSDHYFRASDMRDTSIDPRTKESTL